MVQAAGGTRIGRVLTTPAPPLLLRSRDGLIEIPNDVVHILNSNRDSDEVLAHAGGQLLRIVQLLVGGGGRVNDQALGVTEVGQVREDLHGVDQFAPRLRSALDAERDRKS